jgi:hypothetical protein
VGGAKTQHSSHVTVVTDNLRVAARIATSFEGGVPSMIGKTLGHYRIAARKSHA